MFLVRKNVLTVLRTLAPIRSRYRATTPACSFTGYTRDTAYHDFYPSIKTKGSISSFCTVPRLRCRILRLFSLYLTCTYVREQPWSPGSRCTSSALCIPYTQPVPYTPVLYVVEAVHVSLSCAFADDIFGSLLMETAFVLAVDSDGFVEEEKKNETLAVATSRRGNTGRVALIGT